MRVSFSKMNKTKHFHSFDVIFVQLNWSKNEKIIQVVVIFLLKCVEVSLRGLYKKKLLHTLGHIETSDKHWHIKEIVVHCTVS